MQALEDEICLARISTDLAPTRRRYSPIAIIRYLIQMKPAHAESFDELRRASVEA